MNGPPVAKPDKAKDKAKEIKSIQRESEKLIANVEYVRKITTKQIEVTRAEPPLAKIEKIGNVTAFVLRRIPKDSEPCLIEISIVKFVSPVKNPVKNGQREA